MGKLFASFDEAWSHFLARRQPLESFYAELPDDPDATIVIWIAVPPERVVGAALRLQRAFAHFGWIAPLPRHFLHVTLRAGLDWAALGPFGAEYGPVGCFHDAVVAEVRAPAVEASVADPLFRPHLSLGYFREPHDPEPLRQALSPLRDVTLGRGTVTAVQRVRVPVAKSRLLEPWTALETVDLGAG